MPDKRARIFLVEDEAIIAKDVALRLGSMGYDVAGMENSGERAAERCALDPPDLVLMDIALSGEIDGVEAVRRIREAADVPVVYLTANADEAVMQRAKVTEPFGYLIKPFDSSELHSTIQMALYKHRMDGEVRRTREQYRQLLFGVGAVPWEYDVATDSFIFVGPQAEAVLGYGPERWTGISFWKSVIHEEDREEAYRARMARPEDGGSRSFDYRMVTAGGEVRWIRDIVSDLTGAGGRRTLLGFMQDITDLKEAEQEREKLIAELREAIANIKTLRGLLPICAWCKKIRDDSGYWTQVETYVKKHSDAEFTHGICPDCIAKIEGNMPEKGGKKPGAKGGKRDIREP